MEILEYIERWKFDWIIYLKWNGVESLQSRNPPILKSFSFINHSTFRLALGGNRKYFHVPFFFSVKKLHFVLPERIFHRRNLLSTFHWFHLSQHEKKSLSFFFDTKTLNGWRLRSDTFKEWKLFTRITVRGWAILTIFFFFSTHPLTTHFKPSTEQCLLKSCQRRLQK